MGKMKFTPVLLFLIVAFLAVLAQGDLFRARRHDSEIKNSKGEIIHGKTGTPLVHDDKKVYTRTGIPQFRFREDVDSTGDSTFRREDEEMDDEKEDSETKGSDADSGDSGDESDDKDESDDEEDSDDKDKKNPEELGQGYEKIGDMGSKNKDDDDDEDDKSSEESKESDEDIMSKSSGKSGDSKGTPDLSGEFPPSADQVANLPKDEELSVEQADRQMADKKKGYVQFTIRQKFRPELKYKETAAYKILSGNVREDVERALKATGVVRDVLFREAKNVGGPPYRSKVQVFLKLKNVSEKKLKRIVNHGLINGMITVRGSFYAS